MVGDAARRTGSAAAAWFDVEWTAAAGKVILPVLGDPLDAVVERFERTADELRLGPQRWPLAPGTEHLPIGELLDQQHYRLQFWRDPARNVRRFFTIDDLVAVHVADRAVAAVVDTVPRLLTGHEAFAGVRVDHVDGLADPLGYLEGLRDVIGDRWLVVEKILAAGEVLPTGWPVEGTTGYEHATVVEHALLDVAGWGRLHERWTEVVDDARPFRDWELQARREVLDRGLRPDLERVTRVAAGVVEGPSEVVEAALTELSIHLERYRTYLPEGADALTAAREEAVGARPTWRSSSTRSRPGSPAPTTSCGPAGSSSPARRRRRASRTGSSGGTCRWPRCARSGATPIRPPAPPATLHAHHRVVQEHWPTTLLAGTTHDTKRAEDVRAARPGPRRPSRPLARPRTTPGRRDRAPSTTSIRRRSWLALQTVVTTPGIDADRLREFLVKAAREADVRSSWSDPTAPRRTAWPGSPPRSSSWPPAQELAEAVAGRGRAVGAGAPGRAADRPRCARPVPGHRGVPLRARRSGQPG